MNSFYQSKIRALRNSERKNKHLEYNRIYSDYMDNLLFNISKKEQAKIIGKLENLPANVDARQRKADMYRQNITAQNILHPKETSGSVCWRYTILVPVRMRDNLLSRLRKQGIPASTWFPPIHVLFHKHSRLKDFPGARSFSRKVINLWVDSSTKISAIKQTAEEINTVLKKK